MRLQGCVELGSNILLAIEQIAADGVTVVERPRGSAMVFPLSGGSYRIAKGRVFASGRTFTDRNEAEAGGGYEPLRAT